MRTQLIRTTVNLTLVATMAVLVGACGDDGGSASDTAAADPTVADPAESAYCDTAREWAIRELQPVDDSDPVAFRAYWEEYQTFEQAALADAPDEIQADWQLKVDTENETITPVLEAYDFDINELMATGTPEELAATEAPAEVQTAQDAILTYEADVCGAQQPRPADVSFAGEEPGPYCDLVTAQNERVSEVLTTGADPAEVQAVFAELDEGGPAIVDAAPEAIAAEVSALVDWTTGPQRDVLERHDWDMVALIREGPAQDRAALQQTDPAIRDDYATVAAYEEQVCGA